MSAVEALREIREVLIRLVNDEKREYRTAMEKGELIPVIVGRAEDIGRADSVGPAVMLQADAGISADLRREAILEIERLVDDVLIRGCP